MPAELEDEPVRKFSSFTSDLKSMARWLLAIGITTVAMESTGIYLVTLYEILVGQGTEDHDPLRRIRQLTYSALDRLNPSFFQLYASEGRPSVRS